MADNEIKYGKDKSRASCPAFSFARKGVIK